MTIGVLFEYAAEPVEVRVEGNNVLFRTTQTGGWASIDNLQLDYSGVIKEFPNLKGNDNWRTEAIKRFKDKIKKFKTEQVRINYIINDLKQHGYVPRYIQKKGHRPKAIQ
jgi:hypothetical protein